MHQKFCWMLYKWASYILGPRALKKESGFSNHPSINMPSDGFLILKVNSFSWDRICFSSSAAPGLSGLLFSMIENFPILPYYLSLLLFLLLALISIPPLSPKRTYSWGCCFLPISFGSWTNQLTCSVQSLSRVRFFVTPWTVARKASLSITSSRSSPKFMSIESVIPSNHLTLCHPLLLLPSIFPSIRVFSNESALCIRWPKDWSFSFNISPSNEHTGLISFRMDWLDLLAVQGSLKSLLQHLTMSMAPLKCFTYMNPLHADDSPVRQVPWLSLCYRWGS